ncbi:LysR family transcriptional regulator [Shewanella morhuae]|uniref:Chromosome replication initiation inhibitor protein n=1 Tax=Shewanella morhuae TaxID=365591 RepID=A0A380B748_9GAMM|nr:LysR family transcriptional regulator [Shewanella morhuae]SUI93118.1 chromosome replication initiation inhibitor protein [Shewanella morhuae]
MLQRISKLDHFSLRVLIELIEQQSVTTVALRLNVTQPKISRTLTMLRDSFGDELLTREQNLMRPTKLAESLYEPMKSLVESYRLLSDVVNYQLLQKKEINVAVQNHMGQFMLDCLQETAKDLSLDLTFNIYPWTDQVQRLLSLSQMDYSLTANPPDSDKIYKYLVGHIKQFFLVAHREHPIFTEHLSVENAFSSPLALLNYCITEQKQHRIETLAEKFNIPINVRLKTMDLNQLFDHLENSDSVSYLASMLIKQPIASRKTLKAFDVTKLFSKETPKIKTQEKRRPTFSLYLQAAETSSVSFTKNLEALLRKKMMSLNY